MTPSSQSGESVRNVRKRKLGSSQSDQVMEDVGDGEVAIGVSWRRILLLIIAITVHNIPGKLDRSLNIYTSVRMCSEVYGGLLVCLFVFCV